MAAVGTLMWPGVAFASDGVDAFSRALQRGPLYAALAAFAGGLLVSLTPCVYPMIAITVSVFGARQSPSRLHSMALSTSFVLGIAAMFTPLGVIAGLTGNIFGTILSNRWVVGAIAIVFLALSASMLGAYEMVLPSRLTNRIAQLGGIGMGGAFALGLVSGIIAAPCTGPVLTGILLWIGKTQSPGLGALALSAFSLGLGVPFWLVGTFAVHLPKSGAWMVGIKTFFGIVLAIVGFYFLRNALPALGGLARPGVAFAWGCGALILIGLLGGAFSQRLTGTVGNVRKYAAVTAAIVGGFLLVTWLELPRGQLRWEHSEKVARARALSEKRPLLIDFTATWCAACGELSRTTFADPEVMSESTRFVSVKVDATDEDNGEVNEAKERYHVVGLPTVVLIGTDGVERARFTEFVPPPRFLQAIRLVD